MFDIDITYFDVSPEIIFDNKKGHLVHLAYTLDIISIDELDLLIRNFDFIEQIVFRLEWKRLINGEYILLHEREKSVYPMKRFKLSTEDLNFRTAKCFLDREFLKPQAGFIEAGELSCRISLQPILAFARKALYYSSGRLSPMQEGSLATLEEMKGYEY